jgi:adenosylcobinamide-GDP ribazoletransferase
LKKMTVAFFMAWGMFFAVPCPYRVWEERARPAMIVCFPLVGAMIGCLWGAFAYLLMLADCPLMLRAALLALLPYLLSGFIHLDGFMDCSDAILSRLDLAERRRILKDPHVGSFAVIALCALLLLMFSLFASLDEAFDYRYLFLIPVVSRAASAMSILAVSPMEGSSYAGAFRQSVRLRHKTAAAVLLLASIILSVVIFGVVGLRTCFAVAGVWLANLYGVRQLGGMSGDIAGYALSIGELCGVAALVLG